MISLLPTAAYGAIVKVECLNLGRLHPDSDGQLSPATVAGPYIETIVDTVIIITGTRLTVCLIFDTSGA